MNFKRGLGRHFDANIVRVQMDSYHCVSLEFECKVPSDLFDRASFLADIKDTTQTSESNHYGWSFGSKTNPLKQHADIMIRFLRDNVRIRLAYHQSEYDSKDTRPPFMEDCANWLGTFVTPSELESREQALYLFKDYASALTLPFPLLSMTEGVQFEGVQVTGVAMRLPSQQDVHRLTIDKDDDGILISVCGDTKLNLKEFRLETELERLATVVNPFVRESRQA